MPRKDISQEKKEAARKLMANPKNLVGDIAEEIGVSRQTLYTWFPDLKLRHSGRPLRADPAETAEAKKALKKGATIEDVRKTFHIGRNTLHRNIPGLKGSRRGAPSVPQKKINKARKLLATRKLTTQQICKRVGMSDMSLRKHVPETKGYQWHGRPRPSWRPPDLSQ